MRPLKMAAGKNLMQLKYVVEKENEMMTVKTKSV